MKHAFIMNSHRDLAQAAVSAPLYRRYWSERSELLVYYDGVPDYDPVLMETVRQNASKIWVGPYEARKSQSIFNAVNALASQALERGFDVVSFVHADMIPLYRGQFYSFLDRFWQSGKIMTHSRMWPTSDYIDFANLHFRLRDALALNLLPIRKLMPDLDFNEAEATLSFDRLCPDWRSRTYPMWSMTWPIHGASIMRPGVPIYYLNSPEKTGHDLNGSFTFHNYLPESTVIHVNSPYFWENYRTLSDGEPPPTGR